MHASERRNISVVDLIEASYGLIAGILEVVAHDQRLIRSPAPEPMHQHYRIVILPNLSGEQWVFLKGPLPVPLVKSPQTLVNYHHYQRDQVQRVPSRPLF